MEIVKKIASFFEYLLSGILAVIFILTVLQVVLRYIFNTTIIGGYEIIGYLFIYTTSIGAALLIGRDEHIRITAIIDLLPNVAQKIINVIVSLLTLGLHILLLVLSFRWIESAGGFPSPLLRIPQRCVQISIPVGCVLAIIYLLIDIVIKIINPREIVEK